MRWTPGGDRSDVEDRRGEGGGGMSFGGLGGAHLGIGGTLVLVVLSLIFRTNLCNTGSTDTGAARPAVDTTTQNRQEEFAIFVLNDVQATWAKLLPAAGA